jgi:hypothetical protein
VRQHPAMHGTCPRRYPLATLDAALSIAARAEGVPLIGEGVG